MSGAKVTTLRVPTPGKNLGKFHCQYFNLFDGDDLEFYQDLRQRDNDGAEGLTIGHIKEFIRKKREETYEGEMKTVCEEEYPYVYVEWWVKEPKRKKGDSHEERKTASEGWR